MIQPGSLDHLPHPFTKHNVDEAPPETAAWWVRADRAPGRHRDHPGGIDVVMGDDSVKFIKNGVNEVVWWSLQTIQGGEVIGADAY